MHYAQIKAFNQQEALFLFKQMHPAATVQGINVTYQPVEGKQTKVDDRPNKGTRKWVTKYYVYQYDYKYQKPDGSVIYKGMRRVGETDDKTSAIQLARSISIETQQRMTIRLVKVLDNGENIVADLEPKRHETTFQVAYE